MADVKLVKSIYTGADVTSLGELAAADTASIPGYAKIIGLTASLPVVTDADKVLASLAYTGATSFRKNLGLETSNSPTFAGLVIADGGTVGLGAGKGLIQFDDETTDFISFSNCNVGIGTTGPASILDVQAASAIFRLQSTTGTNSVFGRWTNTGGISYFGLENSAGGDLAAGSLAYSFVLSAPALRAISLAPNGTVALTAISGGNVGIGTTGPEAKLDIVSNDNSITYPLLLQNNYNSETPGWGVGLKLHTALVPSSEPYKWAGIVTRTSGTWGISNNLGFFVTDSNFDTAPTEKVTILGSGNVGIGTTAPGKTLDVVGQLRTFSSAASGSGEVFVGNPAISDGQGLLYFIPSNTVKNWQVATNAFVAGDFSITPSTVTGGSTFTTPVLLITSTGKVGIGDTAPGELLDVAGNINATGVLKIDDVQVVGNRVIDARCDDTINSGDATTDGVIDSLRDAMITHGLIAAA